MAHELSLLAHLQPSYFWLPSPGYKQWSNSSTGQTEAQHSVAWLMSCQGEEARLAAGWWPLALLAWSSHTPCTSASGLSLLFLSAEDCCSPRKSQCLSSQLSLKCPLLSEACLHLKVVASFLALFLLFAPTLHFPSNTSSNTVFFIHCVYCIRLPSPPR